MNLITSINFRTLRNDAILATYKIDGRRCATFVAATYRGLNFSKASGRLANELGALTQYDAHVAQQQASIAAAADFCDDNGQPDLGERLLDGITIEWPAYSQPLPIIRANRAINYLARRPAADLNVAC